MAQKYILLVMTVLLAAINARYTHSSLAVRYLRNAMEAAAAGSPMVTEIILREYYISQPKLEVVRDIAAIAPDLFLGSVYIWNAEFFSAIMPDIKALLPGCKLILGGPEADSRPEHWLNGHPELDILVQGQAEGFALMLGKAQFNTATFSGRLVKAPPVHFADTAFPYSEKDFLDLEKRYLYYESSRGCPFRCSYCLSAREDQRLDEKDAETVIGELEKIALHEPFLVKFVDRSFNAKPDRAREIWRYLINAHGSKRTRWHFELHPLLLEEEDFALLAMAPEALFQFELGVQTVNEAGRSAVDRAGNWPKEKGALVRLIGMKKAHIHLDLIAGLPGEDLDRVAISFNELMELEPDHIQLGFLKGLPSTPLRDRADLAYREERVNSPDWAVFQSMPPYEVLRTSFLSSDELGMLKGMEKLVDSLYNSGRFMADMKAFSKQYGSYFSAYLAVYSYCAKTGFDLRTRDKAKLELMLAGFKASFSSNS
ncbi:B12-binding domain-containing radical SAM protein [Spirochaetota bacterium]